jgi:hypothetical protein
MIGSFLKPAVPSCVCADKWPYLFRLTNSQGFNEIENILYVDMRYKYECSRVKYDI